MANLNESLKEAVCIEEEIFFGPITDKERKIREQFQSTCENENKLPEPSNVNENDISKNDSLYKSFSVEESRYDSFDDSLNEEVDKMPKETKHATLRKSLDKLKSKRYGFYDSLEDVCSLMSNLDKCSISCEVENDANLNNLHVVEDSLKNPPVPVANKSHVLNEQIDDDSLAIAEYENTFDDSLEEVNVLESIEVEEIEDVENLIAENHYVSIRVENNDPVCASRNLFDTSVQVIYEKKKDSDTTDHEELFDDKNLLYDSLSNSDLKDILKDSLDESDKQSEYLDLLKKMSESDVVNVVTPNIRVENQNLFDSSVQVIFDTRNNCDITDQEESSDDKNILYDSLSNSDFKDVLKDSSVESEKLIKHIDLMNQDSNLTVNAGGLKSESINSNLSPFDTSVQIIYENFCNVGPNESTLEKTDSENNDISKDSLESSKKNDISKDSLENSKDISIELAQKSKMKITTTTNLHTPDEKAGYLSEVTNINEKPSGGCLSNTVNYESALRVESSSFEDNKSAKCNSDLSEPVISSSMSSKTDILSEVNETVQKHPDDISDIVMNENVLCLKAPIVDDDKITKSNVATTEPVIPISTSVPLDVQKEAFSVDSCHLKILTDDTNSVNIDKDLKFQVHLELTIGDKKCQIATDNLKLAAPSSLAESVSVIAVKSPLASPVQDSAKCMSRENEIDILDTSSSDLNNQEKLSSMSSETIEYMNSCEKARRKTETSDISNITQRGMSCSSKMFSSPGNLNNTSLLQALDLHDISLFLNDSLIQSENSLMPLNLSSRDDDEQNIHTAIPTDNGKENVPEEFHFPKKKSSAASCKKISPNKVESSKTPRDLQKCSSFKETTKKTPGTKIPVRKIENFAVPIATPVKFAKQAPSVLSSEKVKKCTHSPHSIDDGDKKTPGSTPNKAHHYCKVRNTIFSKVPQMVPSKKYMNIQSPVAQYINSNVPVKTPCFDQVLRDCMNRPVESPYCSHQTPKSGSLKSVKKKI